MAVVAEAALDDSELGGGVLVNLEINRTCGYTQLCGDTCVLNKLAPDTAAMTRDRLRAVARDVLSSNGRIRHLALVGKEVLDTPERLFEDVLEPYHVASTRLRPDSIGIITSGRGLPPLVPRFVDT